MVRKIVATDPLAIGGARRARASGTTSDAWEADIKYYENYVYDRGLRVGTYYTHQRRQDLPLEKEIPESWSPSSLDQILSKNTGEQTKFITRVGRAARAAPLLLQEDSHSTSRSPTRRPGSRTPRRRTAR